MTEIKASERTVSRGLSKHAVIHMVKLEQICKDGKWETINTIEEDMNRDRFELMIGKSVVDWFNSVFGDGTFTVKTIKDGDGKPLIEAINTCPNGEERNHETYRIVSE